MPAQARLSGRIRSAHRNPTPATAPRRTDCVCLLHRHSPGRRRHRVDRQQAGQAPSPPLDSTMDGAGGAGLVPLAFITGYGSSDRWGGNAHVTTVHLNDFQLTAYGVAVGALDRFELSFARHELEVIRTVHSMASVWIRTSSAPR